MVRLGKSRSGTNYDTAVSRSRPDHNHLSRLLPRVPLNIRKIKFHTSGVGRKKNQENLEDVFFGPTVIKSWKFWRKNPPISTPYDASTAVLIGPPKYLNLSLISYILPTVVPVCVLTHEYVKRKEKNCGYNAVGSVVPVT